MKKITKNNRGFTIIEVLIVLAIIAVMMLAVFLAVPALNRNSRNNSIEKDAQTILGAVGDFRGANNGANPTDITNTDGLLTVTGGGTTNPVENRIKGNTLVANEAVVPDAGTINYQVGQKCTSPTAAAFEPNPRSVAVIYVTETGATTNATHCVDS